MRLLLVSEGILDVGHLDDSVERWTSRREGAVRVLVRRFLGDLWNREINDWEIEADYLPRVHALSEGTTGYERKVYLAIVEAEVRECSAVAIVVDQDGPSNGDRLGLLQAGRSRGEEEGLALAGATALGVAVHTVETWLVADELALNEVLRPAPAAHALPALESRYGRKGDSAHPKSTFREIVGRATRECATPYEEVAGRVRLDILEQRCPSGFARFADELRHRLRDA